MINTYLATMILNESNRIATAIESGNAYEIWMQVELYVMLRNMNAQVAREVPYPNGVQALDVLFRDVQGIYAVELKVESANNAAVSIINDVNTDVAKIANFVYADGTALIRWVVAIAYSKFNKDNLIARAYNPAITAVYNEQNGILCYVETV